MERNLRINIDPSGAVVGARQFNRSNQSMQNEARQTHRRVTALNRSVGTLRTTMLSLSAATAGLSIGAGLVGSVRTIAQFEENISRARAVTQEFGGRLGEAEALAREMGATTRFTAAQAADAIAFLGQAGFQTQEIFDSLGSTLDLAVAGQLELGESADIASNILKAFNLEAEETTRVADVLATTAANTNTNIRQASEAMKFAAPIAANLGVQVEEASAAIGVLGDAGIQATLAGTGLRQILLSTVSATDKAEEALMRLGLSMEDIDIEGLGVVEVFRRLNEAGLDAAAASDIFQRRAAGAALVLARNVDRLEEMTEANEQANGAAREMAEIMDDNLTGSFRAFISVLSEAALQLGTGDEGLSGALKSMLDTSTGVIRVWVGMEETLGENRDRFESIANAIELVVKGIGTLIALRFNFLLLQWVAGLGGLQAAFLGTISAIASLQTRATALSLTMRTMFGPAGLVLLAAEAFFIFGTRTDEAASSVDTLVEKVDRLTLGMKRSRVATLEAAQTELQLEIDRNRRTRFDAEVQLPAARDELSEKTQGPLFASGLGVGAARAQARVFDLEEDITSSDSALQDLTDSMARLNKELDRAREEQELIDDLGKGGSVNTLGINEDDLDSARDLVMNTRTELEQYRAEVEEIRRLQGLFPDTVTDEVAGRAIEQAANSITAVREAAEAATTDVERYAQATRELSAVFQEGLISPEQYTARIRELQEELAETPEVIEELDNGLGDVLGSGLREAIRNFDDLEGVLENVLLRLVDLAAEILVIQPLLRSLGELTGGGSGDGSGVLGTVVGALFQGGLGLLGLGVDASATAAATPSFSAQLGNVGIDASQYPLLSGNFAGSFAQGGAFTVPGTFSPVDNQFVGFNARAGERVTIEPPGASSSMDQAPNVTIINQAGADVEVRQQEGGSVRDMEIFIRKQVADDARRGGSAFRAIQQRNAGATR